MEWLKYGFLINLFTVSDKNMLAIYLALSFRANGRVVMWGKASRRRIIALQGVESLQDVGGGVSIPFRRAFAGG